MRKNPHVRICGGLGSATTLVYPTAWDLRKLTTEELQQLETMAEKACERPAD